MEHKVSKKVYELRVDVQGETVEEVVNRLEDLVARMKYEQDYKVLHSIGAQLGEVVKAAGFVAPESAAEAITAAAEGGFGDYLRAVRKPPVAGQMVAVLDISAPFDNRAELKKFERKLKRTGRLESWSISVAIGGHFVVDAKLQGYESDILIETEEEYSMFGIRRSEFPEGSTYECNIIRNDKEVWSWDND